MRGWLLALTLLLVGVPAAQAAQPGTVDRSFGANGAVSKRVDDAPGVAGLEVLPGGGIVMIGTVGDQRIVLLRYMKKGGRGRTASLTFPEGVRLDETLLTPTGALLLAGSLGTDAAVLKVSPSGNLDPSFGEGGISRIDLAGERGEAATGLAAQPDGRLLVSVDIDHGQRSLGSWHDLAVARLTSAGQLDGSYAQGGVRRIDGSHEQPFAPVGLALDAQGRLLVAFNSGYTPRMAVGTGVLRLLADGTLDQTYGASLGYTGWGLIFGLGEPIGNDIAADGDRVLLAGSAYVEESGLYAFVGSIQPLVPPDPNDPPYSGDQSSLRLADEGAAHALLLDAEGSILVGGHVGGTAPLLARATDDLKLDRGFGRRGLAQVRMTAVGAIALQPDGDLLAAGPRRIEYPNPKGRSFHLIRLHGGYDRAGPRLSIRLSDDRCSGRVRISVLATDESPLRRLKVRIDGRRLAAVKRKRVTIRARVTRRPEVHSVVARATDVAGNLGARSRRFTCPS